MPNLTLAFKNCLRLLLTSSCPLIAFRQSVQIVVRTLAAYFSTTDSVDLSHRLVLDSRRGGGETSFMVPLKQKDILFNAFCLEATPFPPSATINLAVLKPSESTFRTVWPLLPQSLLLGKFLQSATTQFHSGSLGVKGQSSS